MVTEKRKQTFLLIFLISLLFIINYSFLDKALISFLDEKEEVFVERVIDGDTIVINEGKRVRLLGINAPERGEDYYREAKIFLESRILNKTIKLEFGKDKHDRYNRLLAYIHSGGKNINLELVRRGLANFYFPSGKDPYYPEFTEAWKECVRSKRNLCRKSDERCSECIEIKEFDYYGESAVFRNKCHFECNLTGWEIKDEGRKKFVFPEFILNAGRSVRVKVGNGTDNKEELFWKIRNSEGHVWTKTGDTLFLRDRSKGLVLWRSY